MTDDTMTHAVQEADPAAERDITLAAMQSQIDDLTAIVTDHQKIIEAMFASGQLPPDINR